MRQNRFNKRMEIRESNESRIVRVKRGVVPNWGGRGKDFLREEILIRFPPDIVSLRVSAFPRFYVRTRTFPSHATTNSRFA